MFVHVFITKICRVTYTKDHGFSYLSGISRGVCPTESETSYINVYSLLDWIKQQVDSSQQKKDSNDSRTELDSTGPQSFRVFERICPIINESDSGSQTCEGRSRSVDGKVKIDANKDCHDMKVFGNKVSISSTFYIRIFRFSSFFYVHVTREKLPKQSTYEKFARIMLMKLTEGCLQWNPPNRAQYFLPRSAAQHDFDHLGSSSKPLRSKL